MRSLPVQRLRRNTLFVDVLSVKEFPKRLLLSLLPAEVRISASRMQPVCSASHLLLLVNPALTMIPMPSWLAQSALAPGVRCRFAEQSGCIAGPCVDGCHPCWVAGGYPVHAPHVRAGQRQWQLGASQSHVREGPHWPWRRQEATSRPVPAGALLRFSLLLLFLERHVCWQEHLLLEAR
jgi:hypothetical protein